MWKDKQGSCICSLPAAETPLLVIVPGSAAQTWVLTAGRTWPLPSALQLLLSTAKATLLHAGNQGTHKAQKLIASMRCGMNCVMSTASIKALCIIHGFNRSLSKVFVAPGGERLDTAHSLLSSTAAGNGACLMHDVQEGRKVVDMHVLR